VRVELLTEEEWQGVERLAARLGVAEGAVVPLALRELAGRLDREFEAAADYVLAKNAGLYRRLA
jgi:hypothetical protein